VELVLILLLASKVYKLSIGAACALEWPSERLVIQVLDDSTDPVVKVISIDPPRAFPCIFASSFLHADSEINH
jgi:hypothetical protein